MKRIVLRLLAALVFGIAVVGCGSDAKEVNPKAPADAPKLEQKMPTGGAKPSGPKGKSD